MEMIWYPVEGCQGQATIGNNLQVNFVQCHVQDTLVILEEDNQPLPL